MKPSILLTCIHVLNVSEAGLFILKFYNDIDIQPLVFAVWFVYLTASFLALMRMARDGKFESREVKPLWLVILGSYVISSIAILYLLYRQIDILTGIESAFFGGKLFLSAKVTCTMNR